MTEFIIVGDTKDYTDCLVYACGRSEEYANSVLKHMLENPDERDLEIMRTHSNLRVKAEESSNCWWNDPFLAN